VTACHIAALDDGHACTVHRARTPCGHDGEPAAAEALHTDGTVALGETIDTWMRLCGGHRPLLVHQGSFDGPRRHIVYRDWPCWCTPYLIPAAVAAVAS
jgi:hypothetical protein